MQEWKIGPGSQSGLGSRSVAKSDQLDLHCRSIIPQNLVRIRQ